jgi:hypothetical protein
MGLMSDQAPELDPFWRNSYFEALEAAEDPTQAAALLARMQGGGQQLSPDGSPASASAIVSEATPYPTPEAAGSFGELLQDVPNIQKIIASGDAEAAQQAAWELAERYNATADAHAREKAPHHYPPPPATDNQGLAELNEQVRAASIDLGSLDQAASIDPSSLDHAGALKLAGQVNDTLAGINDAHLARQDAIEAARQAAEARRASQRRQEAPLVQQLEKLLAQARAGQQPAGR